MTGPARIKGTKLSLTIGTTEIHEEGTAVLMDNEEADGDVTTFADADAGGARQYFLAITATQSTQGDSFWRMLWANTGEDASFVYRPHGNVVASADEPHFTGTLKIPPKPPIGGEAGTTSTFTFETRLDIYDEPAMDDGATSVPLIVSVEPASPVRLDDATVYGSRFTGATAVTIMAVACPFEVIDDGTLSVYVAAGVTAGAAKSLLVTNADGVSDSFLVTVV